MSSELGFSARLARRSCPRAACLRVFWLRSALGLGLTIGLLLLPGSASAATRHFTITNASSLSLKLLDLAKPDPPDFGPGGPGIFNSSVEAGPPVGAVIEPGATTGFELTYFFLSTNGVRADFSATDAQGTDVGIIHVNMLVDANSATDTVCRVNTTNGGREMCIAGGGAYPSSVTILDAPGTVQDIPASVKQQQAQALQNLCINGSATCSFTAKQQQHLTSQGHQVGGYVDNPGDLEEKTRITVEDHVGTSDSVDVGVTAGGTLFKLVTVEIEAKYQHEWTQEHVFGQDVDLVIPARKRCWFVATSPIVRYTGDFRATLGNTIWNLTDIYFDGPDTEPSPPAASWGYTPKCVDLPSGAGIGGPGLAPGSKLVLRGRYKSPARGSIGRPLLKLAIVGPSRLYPGAPTAYRIVLSVSRPGRQLSYAPQNVRVRVRLGHRQLRRWLVRALSTGRAREFQVAVRAGAPSSGRVCLTATASARNAIGARIAECLILSPSPIGDQGEG